MTNLFEFYTSLLQKNLPANSNKISLPLIKITLKFTPRPQILL